MTDAEFNDDASIPDDMELWRRIPPWNWVYDQQEGRYRPKSTAFDNHPSGSPMSVMIAAECSGPGEALSGHDRYALAVFTAGLARSCGQRIVRDPLPDNPAHALVFGRKTESVRRRLARGSRWVVPPPDQPEL